MHRIDGPGATLDNKFTDGDPVGGVQATLVTEDWLNDVQEEIISVLADQSIAPLKGVQTQLLAAIKSIAANIVQATESILGGAKVSTQSQINAGTDDATFVTPKKLRAGFASNLAATGYIAFPTWLGGFIIQWGGATFQVGTSITQSSGMLPIAFPNAPFRIFGYRTSELQASNSPTTDHYFTVNGTSWFVNHVRAAGSVSVPFAYIAIGW
ncbi:hypothetical protein [Pseudomonas frederiksbergensis]|uniref:gp53-like domain-containing protein n=1 Tax=Pseudomonas frederiksbergensis TaxID=104087 RepID=UPI000696C0EF|nr:hypothetical protein [Pseudomonas frederiksbergensis]